MFFNIRGFANLTILEILKELEERSNDLTNIQSKSLDIDTLQPLIDLGYLTLENCKQTTANTSNFLKKAIKEFRTDYERHQLITQRLTFLPFDIEHYHNYAHSLNEIERLFIQNLLNFDGDFQLKQLPSFGTVSLASRVIHYRLTLLGLYGKEMRQDIQAPFMMESLHGLHQIKSFFKWNISDLDFLNSIGDIEILIDKIYLELDKGDVHKKFIYMDKDGHFDTSKILNTSEVAIAQYYEFLARIFQIRLWMNGLYHGTIDGIIKNNNRNDYSTKNAIMELIEYLKEDEVLANDPIIIQKKINLKKLEVEHFYKKSEALQAFWLNVVDLLYITKSMKSTHGDIAISNIIINQNNETIQEKLFDDDGKFKKKVFEEVQQRTTDFLEGKNRRFYYGIQQFCRALHGVLKNLGRGLRKNLQLGFNFMKRISILLYQEVKEGLDVFKHGLHFLLGNRTIQTGIPNNENAIITKFDLDFDATIFVSNDADSKAIQQHRQKCQNQIHSLKFSLMVTGAILRWVFVLTAAPVSWVTFLLMLAKTFKKIKKQTLEINLK